jgi:protein-arginine kinase activator protein McsA
VWRTNKKFQQQKKDIEKCSTCGVKFSSFASPKKNPCKNQSFTKRKKIVNPGQKNKSKFLASNP